MNTTRNEVKYQLLKLVHSGRSFTEAKAMMKSVTGAFLPEYTSEADLNDILSLEGGLDRLTHSRIDAKRLMELKFTPRERLESSKQEVAGKFVTPYKGGLPLNWKRDGNLIRRGKPNKPKPGSSKGKIGKTKVIGFRQVTKDFEKLVKTLQDLQRKHGKGVDPTKAMMKAYKSVRTQATATIGSP